VLAVRDEVAGTHQAWWDGTADANRPAASGVYFVRLVTPQRSHTVKAVLVR
jgi:hypothetical protein